MNDSMQLILAFIGGIGGGLILFFLFCRIYTWSEWAGLCVWTIFLGLGFHLSDQRYITYASLPEFQMVDFMTGLVLGAAMGKVYNDSWLENKWREFIWLSGWWKVFQEIFFAYIFFKVLLGILDFLIPLNGDFDFIIRMVMTTGILLGAEKGIDHKKELLPRLKRQKWAVHPFHGTGKEMRAMIQNITADLSPKDLKENPPIILTVISDHMGKVKLRSLSENDAAFAEAQNLVAAFISKKTQEEIKYGEECFYTAYMEGPIFYIGDSCDMDTRIKALTGSHPKVHIYKDHVEIRTAGTGKDAYLRMTIHYEKGVPIIAPKQENQNFLDDKAFKNQIALSIRKPPDHAMDKKKIAPTVISSNTEENEMDLFIQDKAKPIKPDNPLRKHP